MTRQQMNAEQKRLENQHTGKEDWHLWGPYLAERAWGTVREDYSEHGTAWEYLDHDQARSRAYRWNEDGMGGICDEQQRLCPAFAFWNGRDPILKERAFGLTGNQGNHREDVKEYFFYLDATPSHSYLRYLYYEQFLSIANAVTGHGDGDMSLWDAEDGFFKDLIITPDGGRYRVDVYSWVGLIPLFAAEVVDKRLLAGAPRFAALLKSHKGGFFQGNFVCVCPDWENARGEHLLALADHSMLARILERLLNEEEFLSDYGVRGVSKLHATRRDLGHIPGVGEAIIEYVPGESNSALFGGNSNWRGPIWMPTNFLLVQALEKYHRFLGNTYKVPVPCLGGQELTLKEIATLISERLVDIYRRDETGRIRSHPPRSPFQSNPDWKDLHLFYEYFHGETGQGLGASHQTGWTGLIANLVMRRYRTEIPKYWRSRGSEAASPTAALAS
ncbi:MAG: hypothetical protein LJE70_13440 [Chromatiaceae bacterium]|nr:hypothetical protein [Chromatiaceae bacterium]